MHMNSITNYKENKKTFLIYLWTILILLLFLKNVFSFYLLLLFFFATYIFIFLIKENYIFFSRNNFNFILYLFFFILLLQIPNSIIFLDWREYFIALPRFLLMPVTFLFFFLINKKYNFIRIFKIYLFFCLLAALSLIFQVYNNQSLAFLLQNVERSELNRYATTMGAVTIYSSTIFFPCLISYYFIKNKFIKNIFIFILLFANFCTLSKAAIINCLFFFFFLLYKKEFIKFFFILFAFYIVSVFSKSFFSYFYSTIESLKVLDSKINMSDSLISQLLYRINLFNLYDQMSLYKFLFGYGFVGGQGVFGLPFAFTGTLHNQYYDLITITGIFGLILLLFILIYNLIFLSRLKAKNDFIGEFLFFCCLISIINMFFFSGFLFQPYTSFFIWIAIVYQIKRKILK